MLETFFKKQTRHNHRLLKLIKSLKQEQFSKRKTIIISLQRMNILSKDYLPSNFFGTLFKSQTHPMIFPSLFVCLEGPMCDSCIPHAKASAGHQSVLFSVLMPSQTSSLTELEDQHVTQVDWSVSSQDTFHSVGVTGTHLFTWDWVLEPDPHACSAKYSWSIDPFLQPDLVCS